jgi:hypothetical protein
MAFVQHTHSFDTDSSPPPPYINQPQQQPYQTQQMPLIQQQPMPPTTPQQIQQAQHIIQNMPPEKLQSIQNQTQQTISLPYSPPYSPPQQYTVQQPQRPTFTTTAPSGLFGPKHTPSPSNKTGPQDAQKSDSVKRFFGDTLFGRVARSSVQTATSLTKIPTSLSPWGDNNPVTLPNVRYRDAVLFTTFAFVGGPLVDGAADSITGVFGADSFISEIINSGAGAIAASTVLKYSVFQLVEQALDKGVIEHMLPDESAMLHSTHATTLRVTVKHKLMGVDADLRFSGVRPATDPTACAKGWFAPYLFASARTPSIPRANDFSIATFFGPLLAGDYALAHTLLAQTPHVLSLCDPNPTTDVCANRMLVLFTALSPYRSTIWSTSRRPGGAMLHFHLPSGCPALVVPVSPLAPVAAWSPWTLAQMLSGQGGYTAEAQHAEICEWIDGVVSLAHMDDKSRARYVEVLGRGVSLVINAALALRGSSVLAGLDAERAGIVMFRY